MHDHSHACILFTVYLKNLNTYTISRLLLLPAFFCFWGTLTSAQPRLILSGLVYNSETKEALEGASVVDVQSGRGTSTDEEGRFSLELIGGANRLRISFLGFSDLDTLLELSGASSLDFFLTPSRIEYEEVQVAGNRRDDFVNSIRSGDFTLRRDEISRLPKLLGEADPVRFLQLTPGVQSSSEGGIGFYVRGGGVDQNLVLYDGATVYNPGHLLGFISVFNPDIISEVSLLKSGIPASFGGRLSSVIRVQPDPGRSDSLRIKGQLGMVASRISLNRSLAGGRASIMLSARMASLDLLIKPLIFPLLEDVNPFLKESSYNFYDFSGTFVFRPGSRDQLSLSSYFGKDKYGISRSSRIAETAMDWGNFIVSGRWTHSFSDKLILATTLSRTDYNFDLGGSQNEFVFSLLSSVRDYSLKSKLDYFGKKHNLSFGYELTRHTFVPNDIDAATGGLLVNFLSYTQLFAWEGGIFAEDEIAFSDRFGISLGLRYSFFSQVGPYTEYVYDEISLLKDSILFGKGQNLAFYSQPEPRISAKYKLDENSSLKASYMHMAQYVHLATSSTVSLPTDIWLPSSREILPQLGDQVSLGYFTSWLQNAFESSVEIYFKHARNQLEFIRGVISSSISLTLQDNIAFGTGRSYGAEFFLRKKQGDLRGWAGYTISRSERIFDMINDGRVYPAKFDRRHDLSLAGIYKVNEKWNLSAVFIYVSGNAFTLPIGRYVIQGNLVNQYGEVNNFRMPAYHRLDLSANRSVKTSRGNISTWDFSIYNVYNRANPFYIYFETSGDLEEYRLEVNPVIVSLFPIVPTVSWKFEF